MLVLKVQDLMTTTDINAGQRLHDGLTIICFNHNCIAKNCVSIILKKDENKLVCQSCGLSGKHTSVEPLVRFAEIAYPFKDVSKDVRYDLVLIPSQGSFLENFNNGTGLHIGIVQEIGQVLEYDRSGIKWCNDTSSQQRWSQCLDLKFIDHLMLPGVGCNQDRRKGFERLWDQAIDELKRSDNSRWTEANYRDDENNCFDFVLSFVLILMGLVFNDSSEYDGGHASQLRRKIVDKKDFCQNFVVPQTKLAARYISLNRRLNLCHPHGPPLQEHSGH